jgi:tRNA dimethylallyltransferase
MQPLTGWAPRMILLDPPRPALREAVASRFDAMLAEGALDELRAFLALGLDPALPLMRAHGVPELTPYLRGQATLAEATARAVLATHQYTKRQATWFRHQKLVENSAMQTIHARISSLAQLSESFVDNLINFINHNG